MSSTKNSPPAHAESSASNPTRPGTMKLLAVAAWFGLVSGLVEGAVLFLFQKLGWLNWFVAQMGVWWEILWISPLVDLLLFLAIGLGLSLVERFLPERMATRVILFSFSFLMFLDWLLLSGRLRISACLMLAAGLATVFTRRAGGNAPNAWQWFRKSLSVMAAIFALVFVVVQGGGWLAEKLWIAKLPAPTANAPNVLFIVMDTVRADHLSLYGYGRPTTPKMDELAKQSVLFERAYSASSWTLPSHASLLTGRYPFEHGAEQKDYNGNFRTLPEALRDRGYRTAAFSANTVFFSRISGFGQGFSHFEDIFQNVSDMFARTVYGRRMFQYVLRRFIESDMPGRRKASDISEGLLHWLDRGSSRPFFAFVNYMDAHDPYLPPQPFRSRFSKLQKPGGRVNSYVLQHSPKLTPAQMQEEVDAYDGAIAYIDDEIGKLLAELARRGPAENTIVIITSDHGEAFGEHGQITHRNALYRPLIHVPLMIRWPGKIPAEMRLTPPVSNVALAATVIDLVGASGQNIFPGMSLAGAWKNPNEKWNGPYPLAELAKFQYAGMEEAPVFYGAMESLVSEDWQYIRHETQGAQLFDWLRDPEQNQNLANTAEGARACEEFARMLDAMRRTSQALPPTKIARAGKSPQTHSNGGVN